MLFFFVPSSVFLFCPNVVFFVPRVCFVCPVCRFAYCVPNVFFFVPFLFFFVPFAFFLSRYREQLGLMDESKHLDILTVESSMTMVHLPF